MSEAPALVSVVIPALDEAAGIAATLASVAGQTAPWEVILADGGSSDGTPDAARQALPDVQVVQGAAGRAAQLAAGVAAARGSIVVLLHADTRLAAGALDAVRRVLSDPSVVGGCFATTFDSEAHRFGPVGRTAMRVWQARLWMRWHRLAFGDRAPFVRAEALRRAGGIPQQPLFEDLDLVRAIRRHGRFVFLDLPVVTSARRFRRRGAIRQQARNLALWLGWMAGVAPARLAPHYEREPGAVP